MSKWVNNFPKHDELGYHQSQRFSIYHKTLYQNIKQYRDHYNENVSIRQSPLSVNRARCICNRALDYIDKPIAIMFNMEIVDEMIRLGSSVDNISFFGNSLAEVEFAHHFFGISNLHVFNTIGDDIAKPLSTIRVMISDPINCMENLSLLLYSLYAMRHNKFDIVVQHPLVELIDDCEIKTPVNQIGMVN